MKIHHVKKIESKNISITKDQFSKSIIGKLISIRKYLQSIHENSLSISFFNNNLMNEQKSDDLTLETKYQISLGMNDGYAYNLPNFKFILINGNEFEWNNSNV